MSSDVYLNRMKELDKNQEVKVMRQYPDLYRPSPLKKGDIIDINGNIAPEKPEQIEADMSSGFGTSFDVYSQKDNRFGQMMDDYKNLVGVLRQKVERGFMPPQIAEMQMKRFLQDGRKYFSQNQPGPLNNPELRGALEGMLSGAMAGDQAAQSVAPGPTGETAPMPPQGQPPMPNQAPQGAPMPQGGM